MMTAIPPPEEHETRNQYAARNLFRENLITIDEFRVLTANFDHCVRAHIQREIERGVRGEARVEIINSPEMVVRPGFYLDDVFFTSRSSPLTHDDPKFKEARQWLDEHKDLKWKRETPFGTLEVYGDLRYNGFRIGQKFICLQPEKELHVSDILIWRLQMLNWHLDQLMDVVIRNSYIEKCPKCNFTLSSLLRSVGLAPEIHYCPKCAYSIDKLVKDLHVKYDTYKYL